MTKNNNIIFLVYLFSMSSPKHYSGIIININNNYKSFKKSCSYYFKDNSIVHNLESISDIKLLLDLNLRYEIIYIESTLIKNNKFNEYILF